MKKRNPFITHFFRYAFYTFIIILPLLISTGSHLVALQFIKHEIMGFDQKDYYFLENMFRLVSAMILAILSIASVFIWSHHKYDLIVNKIEKPLKKLLKKNNLHKLHFRKSDLFHFFGPLFNEFFNHYLELEKNNEAEKEQLNKLVLEYAKSKTEESKEKLIRLVSGTGIEE